MKFLLIRVKKIEIPFVSPILSPKWLKWNVISLLVVFLVNTPFIPFMLNTPQSVIYLYYAPVFLASFEIFFLNDLLDTFFQKFKLINQQLHREIFSVSLFELFPLTKIEKINALEAEETKFRMEQIQSLSHYHYDLVKLSQKMAKHFEITLITALILWFETVIETAYYIVYMILHGKPNLVIYGVNFAYISVEFWWFFCLIWSFSRVADEANKTGTFVHDVWNKYAVAGRTDKRIRYLQLFSVRLLNTRLQFTAMDFFNFDWTFGHMVRNPFF